MRYTLAVLCLIAMLGGSAYLIVKLSEPIMKQDLAYDLIKACVKAEGASPVCTFTYDMNGTYLSLSVGGEEVYCHSGRIQTC
jgi:hypothetical protein